MGAEGAQAAGVPRERWRPPGSAEEGWRVGRGAVLGPGSVVSRDLPPASPSLCSASPQTVLLDDVKMSCLGYTRARPLFPAVPPTLQPLGLLTRPCLVRPPGLCSCPFPCLERPPCHPTGCSPASLHGGPHSTLSLRQLPACELLEGRGTCFNASLSPSLGRKYWLNSE